MQTFDRAVNDIDRLVEGLNSLHDGERALAQLIAIGSPAVESLKNFLFHGKPSVVYQPRRWAVEALGALKAKDVLLDYLRWKKDIPDPATRFAEQSVENAAARELAAWRTDDVLRALLDIALPHPQAGIIDALGEFGRMEALSYFIRALEDDVCRILAENALRKMGQRAEVALACAARTPLPSQEEERPSSVRRRISALELLASMKPDPDVWPVLCPLLKENEPAIVTAVSKIAASVGITEDRMTAVTRLLEVLPHVDWYLQSEIHDCLVSLHPEAKNSIDREIVKRSALPEENQVTDRALRTLLRVRRGVEANERGGSGSPR